MSMLPSIALLPAMNMLTIANGAAAVDMSSQNNVNMNDKYVEDLMIKTQDEMDRMSDKARSYEAEIKKIKAEMEKVEAAFKEREEKFKEYRKHVKENKEKLKTVEQVAKAGHDKIKELEKVKPNVKVNADDINNLDVHLDNLDDDIDDNRKNIAKNQEAIKEIDTSVKNNARTIVGIETKVKVNAESVDDIYCRLDNADDDIDDNKKGIKKINEELKEKVDVETMNGAIEKVDVTFEEMRESLKGKAGIELEANIKNIEVMMDEIDDKLCYLDEELSGKADECHDHSHDHKGKIMKNAEDIDCLEKEVEILATEVDGINHGQIKTNKKDIKDMKADIGTLMDHDHDGQIEANKEDIETINGKIETNEGNIAVLQGYDHADIPTNKQAVNDVKQNMENFIECFNNLKYFVPKDDTYVCVECGKNNHCDDKVPCVENECGCKKKDCENFNEGNYICDTSTDNGVCTVCRNNDDCTAEYGNSFGVCKDDTKCVECDVAKNCGNLGNCGGREPYDSNSACPTARAFCNDDKCVSVSSF